MMILSVVLATLSLAVGAFAYGVSHAPGARQNSLPSSLFVAAAGYAAADALGYAHGISDGWRCYIASLAIASGGVFLLSAITYVARHASRADDRPLRILQTAMRVAIALSVIPTLVYSTHVVARTVPMADDVFYDAQPTLVGYLVFGTYLVAMFTVFGRLLGERRRGVPYAGYYAMAFGALIATSLADLAAVFGWSPLPYLLTEGIFVAAVLFAGAIVRQINEDRIALEALRVDLERRVRERTEELERRTDELARSERLAVVGRLAAGIAHELNNPAAAIRASLEDARLELLRRGRAVEVLACVDISLAAVDRVTRIVRQFGAMAGGAESDRRRLASTNLNAVLQSAVNSARDASRPDVTIAVQAEPGLWVRGIPSAVEEAISALLLNAVEAIPDGRPGQVRIGTSVADGWVELSVRDNGIGMRDEVVARAFEPFYTTKEIGRSSGLGLPVAKGLIETMGGSLQLKSIPGVGSEAIVRLRVGDTVESTTAGLVRPIEVGPESAAAPTAEAAAASAAPRRPRILLVDDDELVRAAMRRYLSKSYEVDTAGSVQDGLQMASRTYDVILSDVVMPGGGGQRFLSELTARDPVLASRVIFMTGGSFRGDLQEFLRTQGQPVLNKPVRLSELMAAISRLVAAPEA